MKALFLFNLAVVLCSITASANQEQHKLDYIVLEETKAHPKADVTLLSVDRGLMVTSQKLKEYVPYRNNEFEPKEPGFFAKIKKSLSDRMKVFTGTSNDLMMMDKIEETKKMAETSSLLGSKIKKTLDLYREGQPLKILANDMCSATGPKFNVYFKNEVFSFTEVLDPNSASSHTTQIKFKKALAKEKEKFVQVGSYRLSEYETYTYAIRDGDKNIDLKEIKTPIRMIDQFVNNQVIGQLDKQTQIVKEDHAALKLELEKAWKLFKRASSCCAVEECNKALMNRMGQYVPIKSNSGSQGRPSVR